MIQHQVCYKMFECRNRFYSSESQVIVKIFKCQKLRAGAGYNTYVYSSKKTDKIQVKTETGRIEIK